MGIGRGLGSLGGFKGGSGEIWRSEGGWEGGLGGFG